MTLIAIAGIASHLVVTNVPNDISDIISQLTTFEYTITMVGIVELIGLFAYYQMLAIEDTTPAVQAIVSLSVITLIFTGIYMIVIIMPFVQINFKAGSYYAVVSSESVFLGFVYLAQSTETGRRLFMAYIGKYILNVKKT